MCPLRVRRQAAPELPALAPPTPERSWKIVANWLLPVPLILFLLLSLPLPK